MCKRRRPQPARKRIDAKEETHQTIYISDEETRREQHKIMRKQLKMKKHFILILWAAQVMI